MKKHLISNITYGNLYPDIFCNLHLKSMLDETNLPKFRDNIEYVLFTDEPTLNYIEKNRYFAKLRETVPTKINFMEWPKQGANSGELYHLRYSALLVMQRVMLELAAERDVYMSLFVSDMVVARDFLSRLYEKVEAGYDSVFLQPLRSSFECMVKILEFEPRALTAEHLFEAGFNHLHPLWIACHYDCPTFSKIPESLLWNSGTGIMARHFAITPLIFTPNAEMIKSPHPIDIGLPELCPNPYWCREWIEAPIIGVEPTLAFYPPFANQPASVAMLRERTIAKEMQVRVKYGLKKCFYPDEKTVNLLPEVERRSDEILAAVTQ